MSTVYTQQEVQKMVEELDALRKKISEKDVRISKLESDLLWFRNQFFGKTSGSEVTDKLAHRPAELYIKRTIRRKFALKDHSAVVIAPLPASAIHKCMADTTLLTEYTTEIIIQKYLYHIPFHRQIARFSELGVRISSSTVGDWFSQSCELLKPLYDLLQRRVLSTDYIQVDESTLPVIDNEKHRAVKGYIWVVRNPDTGEVFFHYDRGSRSQKTAMILLQDFNQELL